MAEPVRGPEEEPSRRLLEAIGYDELRVIAGRIARTGLVPEPDATSLLHEAIANWLARGPRSSIRSRDAAVASMVTVIRNAAIDRRRRRLRASAPRAVDPALLDAVTASDGGSGIAADHDAAERALDRLRARAPRAAAALELQAYTGMAIDLIAGALGVSVAQVKRDLATAKAFVERGVARDGPLA